MHRLGFLTLMACGTTAGTTDAVYTETHDATNNSNVGGTPEMTGLVLDSTHSIGIDGEVNSGHFDTEDLDYDAYIFSVDADVTGTLTLTGSDANGALTLFDVTIIDVATSHGVGHAAVGEAGDIHLPTGTYRLEVRAQNPTPIAQSYPYVIELAAK